jgi:hypothetical protein
MGPRARAHGAHLVIQVEGIEPSFTALAAPATLFPDNSAFPLCQAGTVRLWQWA